jgi:hypothetical protein
VINPLGAAAAQLMGALVAQGRDDLDNTALLRLEESCRGGPALTLPQL